MRHRGFELQCVKLTPNAPTERGVNGLMLLDPAHPGKGIAHDSGSIMIAIAGEIPHGDLGTRKRGLDQRFDVAGRHRHYRLVLSIIWRRASISLFRSASAT